MQNHIKDAIVDLLSNLRVDAVPEQLSADVALFIAEKNDVTKCDIPDDLSRHLAEAMADPKVQSVLRDIVAQCLRNLREVAIEPPDSE